jgi:hypothetical protein
MVIRKVRKMKVNDRKLKTYTFDQVKDEMIGKRGQGTEGKG